MKTNLISCLGLLLITGLSNASTSATTNAATLPQAETAASAYQQVQKFRNEARKIVKQGNNSLESNQQAALHLEKALDFLNQQSNLDLANGNIQLGSKPLDVRLDIAKLYLASNQKEKAIQALSAIRYSLWFPKLGEIIKADKQLAQIYDEPRIQELIKISLIPNQLLNSPAFATPYKENISTEEKIAGLTLFWTRARDSFVYFDKLPDVRWDKVYLDYLSKVMATKSTAEYYRVLMQLAPLLKDGHTNIYAPDELSDEFYARPPMRAMLVEDKVIIHSIRSPSLRAQLSVGDEITAINQLPVRDYAMQKIAPFISSSTEQDFKLRLYDYSLFSGNKNQSLQLQIRTKTGLEKKVEIKRSDYTDTEPHKEQTFRMLEGGIAYLPVTQFENDASVKAFVAALPEIMQAKGLIIDIRKNGGGSSNYGMQILSYLTKASIPEGQEYIRAENAYYLTRGTAMRWISLSSGQPNKGSNKQEIYTGPVVVLAGPATFSAGEDFLLSYQLLKRGLTIGEATGGSTGQPIMMDLPGGGSARICIKRDTYPDGSDFVGKGLQPDILVKPSIADIRNAKDPVLDRALKELIHK
jgi:carboxyl-terminal processing protease